MATSVASSPVRSTGTGSGSPGFRSQRKLSAGTIMKKIQTLEDTIESLRQQLVFTRTEEESVPPKEVKKKAKQIKEKIPAAAAAPTKQKKIQESKQEEKDKIPMPWTGQADFTTCVGLKAQYGLFIQCGKASDMSSASFQIDNHECRFCNDCSKKCDENGKHAVGTIEERIEAGVGKYVNAKTGKKETMYIEVLEKMKITKEEALESAARRGFQIPDWMLEKAEKKRGRPATTATSVVADKIDTGDETKPETKEKKPRQPRAKTTKATTTKATTKKAATSVATNDTPQKKNSVQSSVCIDLNQEDDEDVTPLASSDAAASASTPIPQEKEKKKRGRPTKSNAQSNIGESEMQRLIVQATTEKKKRLSIDPTDTCSSSQEEIGQIETCLMFESECKEEQLDDDEIFDMFDKMLEEDEKNQQQAQEQNQEVVTTVTIVEPVIVIAANEKKEKSKKAKNSDEKVEKVEKAEKKKDDKVAKNEAAAAAKKKAEEEAAAAAKKKAEEENEETEDEEEEDEDEELECEEYEYDGEIYGLAPNGDIYSQDGELVGKLTNGGAPKMFS